MSRRESIIDAMPPGTRFVLLSLLPVLTCAAAPATAPVASKEQYRSYAMTHQGDPQRGKDLFLDPHRVACGTCHSVDGSGGKVGPDLSAVGDKFGRSDIVEAILNPSASIAVGYSTTVVKTKSGEAYAGIIKDTSDAGISLMGADGKLNRIAAADIDRQRTIDVSLMPEGLANALTLPEFADLVAYLTSLKVPETALTTEHGMPAVIPELNPPVRLVPFHKDENRFEHPVWFGFVPGVADTYAVVEHESGKIWVLSKPGSDESKALFLDTGRFQTGTRGLLGMVFHPGYATNRRYFIVKHLVNDGRFASIVFEGEASVDLKADSGRPLRQVLKMPEATNVHYGGSLQFGPDGYLYVGIGDSGPQGDPQGHAQDQQLLLGKVLRVDVNRRESTLSYSVPTDNPFVGREDVRPEIWAYGLREPWRFSFDPLTGELWVGDVGQDLFEEVDIIRRGQNYGWNVYEAFAPFSNKCRRESESYVPPVFAYGRKYGASVTGGFVYRGRRDSSFYGVYIFGDYVSSRLFGLTQEHGRLRDVRQIGSCPQHVVSFGRDEQGELYVIGYEGSIFKLDFTGSVFK